MQGIIVSEEGPGQGQECRLLITAGYSVRDSVELAGAVLDHEVVLEQLENPCMLCDGRQSLVKEELETPVVSLDGERMTAEVRPPMPNDLNQPNVLAHIGSKLGMVRGNRLAKQ
jgi:hypothetical protein